jgi:hypothetical protein
VKLYVSANGANERQRGIPFPGTFIVDRSGRVKARFFEDSYTVRNTVSNIRVRLNEPNTSVVGTRIGSQHLDVVTYPSDAAIAPGNRFSVVAQITPHNGVHVYAPGAKNYKVVELKVFPAQYMRTLKPVYPRSEIYSSSRSTSVCRRIRRRSRSRRTSCSTARRPRAPRSPSRRQ